MIEGSHGFPFMLSGSMPSVARHGALNAPLPHTGISPCAVVVIQYMIPHGSFHGVPSVAREDG